MPDEWGYPAQAPPQVSSVPFLCISRNVSSQPRPLTDTPRRAQGAIYPSGSATRGASQHHPTVTSTVPICRYPNCRYPATMDERTRELSEYCSGEHMRFVVIVHSSDRVLVLNIAWWGIRAALDLGFPVCPACKTCPRRTDSEFCGLPCESWVAQQEQRQQQERQERHQQHRHWQPSTLGSSSMVPNSGPVTWSNAARGSAAPNSGSRYSWQGRYQQ